MDLNIDDATWDDLKVGTIAFPLYKTINYERLYCWMHGLKHEYDHYGRHVFIKKEDFPEFE